MPNTELLLQENTTSKSRHLRRFAICSSNQAKVQPPNRANPLHRLSKQTSGAHAFFSHHVTDKIAFDTLRFQGSICCGVLPGRDIYSTD